MGKDTFYFSHDYNARMDVKTKKLLKRHGLLGYGIFWALVEDLYNNANALPTDYEGIAHDLRVEVDIVRSVINDFELFVIDGQNFRSNSVEKRLANRNEKSEKARESAKKRWENANALRLQSDGNAIKERKGKEIKERKGKDTVASELFSDERWMTDMQIAHPGKDIKQSFLKCYNHWSVLPSCPTEIWQWKQKLNSWISNDFGQAPKTNGQKKGQFVS